MVEEVVPVRFSGARNESKTVAHRLRARKTFDKKMEENLNARITWKVKDILCQIFKIYSSEVYPYVQTDEQRECVRLGGLSMGPKVFEEIVVKDAATVAPLREKIYHENSSMADYDNMMKT